MIDNQFKIIYFFSLTWKMTNAHTCNRTHTNNKSDSSTKKLNFFAIYFIGVFNWSSITNIVQRYLSLTLAKNPVYFEVRWNCCMFLYKWACVCTFYVAFYESPQILIDSLAEWKFSSFLGHLLLYISKIRSIQSLYVLHVTYHVHNFSEKSQFSFRILFSFLLFVFKIYSSIAMKLKARIQGDHSH